MSVHANLAPPNSSAVELPTALDSTMISAFKECPRKFYWAHVRGLVPAQPSVHLHFGGAYAAGLEAMRKALFVEGKPADEALAAGVIAATVFWDEFAPTWSWESSTPKTLDAVWHALLEYLEAFPPESDPLPPLNGNCIELTFALEVEGSRHPETQAPFLYCGRLDMLSQHADGSIWVVDDKTTGQLGERWSQRWRLRGQLTGYCWAAQEYGYEARNVCIRGMAPIKSAIRFAVAHTHRTPRQIAEWLANLQYTLDQVATCWRQGFWPLNLATSCEAYNGCPYANLCEAEDPERWIEPEYVVRRWDPLANDS